MDDDSVILGTAVHAQTTRRHRLETLGHVLHQRLHTLGQLPTAPRKGDQEAWAPRLAQGMETLVQHVTQGFKAMPPRGLCMDCSAEDYRVIIHWMSE
ncbi:cytochrome c5 family protein [Pseudomonas protegens]|nr:cytochrome c5 family protein [Pseudomonas protegens]